MAKQATKADRELSAADETPIPWQWLMEGFNRVEGKLDNLQKDISDLKVDVARLEEQVKPISDINQKVDRLQRYFWIAIGILAVLAFIARIFLPDINITLTPGP